MREFPVLELLHPDGIARTSLVLGSHGQEIPLPKQEQNLNETIDLLILAPSDEECRGKDWLAAALRTIRDRLSADGIGYLLLPPRWRWKGMSLLHKTGLVMDTVFLHFPAVSSSRYLIPLQRFPGQFTIRTILASPSLKRTLASQMFRYTVTRWFLTNFRGPIGISVRRPGARPLFQWLFDTEQRSSPVTAIVRKSWREKNGASILYGFVEQDSFPSVIAKTVTVENAANLDHESDLLGQMGTAARDAGVRVPQILGKQQNERRSSLLFSFVPGESASDVLSSNPDRYADVMTNLVDWLERWQRATVIVRPLLRKQREQTVLASLNRLAPTLQNAENYRNWLLARSETFLDDSVPLVATHNDLTMANVLLDQHNQLGIVDWEKGCPESYPLTDFYYAVTDAVRIAVHFTNWLDALKACFLPEGPYYSQVAEWHDQLQSAIRPPPDFIEFCFHACWLHHASNEHKTSQPGEPRPFLEIVQWLALHEFIFLPNHN